MLIDPRDSKTTGYHLFCEPSGELRATLKAHIDTLAEISGGISFPPHVTLLARIMVESEQEVIVTTQQLAHRMCAFPIMLSDLNGEPKYFKALYLKAKVSNELMSAHYQACKLFEMKEHDEYVPHLSLAYGNISGEKKTQMMQSLQLSTPIEFMVDRLFLYRTEGEVNDWRLIETFSLSP